ncbi:hypothetical protein [Streptomyces sp. TRM72054]|uniref:hypothetical protein n=1 Tax=Streptomyces sp. TRM72054 TaxID=2870562 RepID=UPI0021AB447B|nr:hypothetical protein [Streptomyces sp. TRM72054]
MKSFLQSALFVLAASPFADFVTGELVTRSDVWLPFNLKGQPQPDVYDANGPRLAALLRDLSKVLELETDPDDPTYFAKPTETGAENFFDADGAASDVWGASRFRRGTTSSHMRPLSDGSGTGVRLKEMCATCRC